MHPLVCIPQASELIGLSPDWPHRLGVSYPPSALNPRGLSPLPCTNVTGYTSGDWPIMSVAGPCRGEGGCRLGCTWGRLLYVISPVISTRGLLLTQRAYDTG